MQPGVKQSEKVKINNLNSSELISLKRNAVTSGRYHVAAYISRILEVGLHDK